MSPPVPGFGGAPWCVVTAGQVWIKRGSGNDGRLPNRVSADTEERPPITIDQKGFHELLEESQDIHADAMREVKPVLADLADLRSDRLRDLAPTPLLDVDAPQKSTRFNISRLLGAGAFGAALAALVSRPASAAEPLDVQMLQTASSLEILAVATYGAALTLPFIKDGNPVVKAFAETTMKQHDEHMHAFQAMTKALGGKEQTNANPKYGPVVEQAKPGLKTPMDVVKLAATLEQPGALRSPTPLKASRWPARPKKEQSSEDRSRPNEDRRG